MDRDDVALVTLLRHHMWANLRLIEWCSSLDPGALNATAPGTYGQVHRTLAHIVQGDGFYLALITGQPEAHRIDFDNLPSLPQLHDYCAHSGQALIDLAGRLRGSDIIRWQDDGLDVAIPAGLMFVQIINHATEHRTHVTTVLSQRGLTHPSLSGWAYAATQVDPQTAELLAQADA